MTSVFNPSVLGLIVEAPFETLAIKMRFGFKSFFWKKGKSIKLETNLEWETGSD